MATEDPDEIVARISKDVPVLAGQLESLAAELRLLSESLSARQPAAGPEPAIEEPPATPRSDEPERAAEPAQSPDGSATVSSAAAARPAPGRPRWSRPIRPARIGLPRFFAIAGSAVTLAGVASVLLPPGDEVPGELARTAIGLALAGLAVGAAVWLRRADPANIGARALLATGNASMLLCVLALTVRFIDAQGRPLVAFVPGLLLTGLVALGGLWAARSWRSQGVAVVAVLGGLIGAPVIGTGQSGSPLAVVASMVLLTLVAGTAQLGLGWVWLLLARTVPTVLYAIWVGASPSVFRWGPGLSLGWSMGVAVLIVALLAVGSFALALLHRSVVVPERVAEAAALTVLATPLMVVAQTQEVSPPGAVACLVVGGFFLAAVGGLARTGSAEVRTVALGLGALLLVLGVMVALDRPFLGYLPWGLAAIVLALAERARSLPALVAGSILGVIGLVWWLPVFPVLFGPSFLADLSDRGVAEVVQSLLGVVVAGLAHRAYRIFLPTRRARVLYLSWAGGVLVGSTAVVLAGSLAGAALDEPMRGFRMGHVLVTFGLALLCLVLVSPRAQARGERRARGRLAIGLGAAAIAKLFLFDTQALPGLWRAGTLVVIGILLLVGGTWYYRQYERGRSGRTAPVPDAVARTDDAATLAGLGSSDGVPRPTTEDFPHA